MDSRKRWSIALLCVAFFAGRLEAQQGGIEVFAGETLFARGTRVSLSHFYSEKGSLYSGTSSVTDPSDQMRSEHRLVAAIDHGLRRDLTLTILAPWIDTSFESNTGDISTSGPGDVTLLAKYRFYKSDWKRGSFNLALIGGAEVPTGGTTASIGGSRVAPSLQNGSGSWDPLIAVGATSSHNRWRFDGLALYKENTEGAQGYEAGDSLALSATAGYRFLHTKYPGQTAAVRVGILWQQTGRATLDGGRVVDSGSQELRLRPGFGWHPRPGIDVTFAVDIPVYEDYGGTQLGLDFRTFLAVGVRF